MMIDLAAEIATLLETELTVDKVAVTAGEPAQTDKCSAVYVWGVQIFDSPSGVQARGDEAGCLYRRAYEFGYRIDVCNEIRGDGRELTAAESLALATGLYDMADTAWCALAAGASDGTLFTAADCQDIVVGPLVIGDPAGDRISARGSLRVTYDC